MKYDDFEGKPIPEMIQRVKVNLREQEIDVFDYARPYAPYPLYFKSRLIPLSASLTPQRPAKLEALVHCNLGLRNDDSTIHYK